ncbi:MAG: hypothetical protein IH840_11245 [Candidatus Heimdallarchaeota archaeon]|nr:hypothetical protein [Candidatus Heimdallarchaeota archaeon]
MFIYHTHILILANETQDQLQTINDSSETLTDRLVLIQEIIQTLPDQLTEIPHIQVQQLTEAIAELSGSVSDLTGNVSDLSNKLMNPKKRKPKKSTKKLHTKGNIVSRGLRRIFKK